MGFRTGAKLVVKSLPEGLEVMKPADDDTFSDN